MRGQDPMENDSVCTVDPSRKKAKVWISILLALSIYFLLQFYFVRELLAAELFFGVGFAVLLVLGGALYLVGAIEERGLDLTEAGVRVIADSSRHGYNSLEEISRTVAPAASQVVTEGNSSRSSIAVRGQLFEVYIDGEAQGRFQLAQARITVGPNGRLLADIEGREIFVDGTVQGNLKASERICLGASSSVQGKILTPRLTIENGAHLHSEVEILRSDSPKNSAAEPVMDQENGAAQFQEEKESDTLRKRVA